MKNKIFETGKFVLSDQAYANLNSLKKETKSKSIDIVMQEAISLYRWALSQRKNGCKIASIDDAEGEEKILEIDTFENLMEKNTEEL